jgi:hypothetical protein
MRWLILLVTMPPAPSRNRVGLWRKLRRMGAVTLKGSAWLLPEMPETVELAQWLVQETQSLGGAAALARTDAIEPMPEAELTALFHRARAEDYRAILRAIEQLERQLGQPVAARAGTAARMAAPLARLQEELRRVRRIDYFDSPAGREAQRRFDQAAAKARTRAAKPAPAPPPRSSGLPPPGSTWVTRPRPHIDRIASAWLIRRFHDGRARFTFAEQPAAARRAIPFDALGAEFGHQGEDCTFETLVKRLGIRDGRVARLAELVHEADLRDGKFPDEHAAGVDAAIRGLAEAIPGDAKLLEAGMTLFDGLYAGLAKEAPGAPPSKSRPKAKARRRR